MCAGRSAEHGFIECGEYEMKKYEVCFTVIETRLYKVEVEANDEDSASDLIQDSLDKGMLPDNASLEDLEDFEGQIDDIEEI